MNEISSKESGTLTLVERKCQKVASREQVAQYLPGFTQTSLSFQTEISNPSSTRRRDSKSKVEGNANPYTKKK